MDRRLYKLPFTPENQLNWLCPTCGQGLLRIKKGSFFSAELSESKKAHDHYDWDPDWVSLNYSCLFCCQNEQCGETIASCGIGYLDWDIIEDEDGLEQQVYSGHFKPKHFEPHLNIINIPKKVPDTVKQSLNRSFELFFSSPAAASNQVRSAVEAILTDLKIKRYSTKKNHKRSRLNLHQRIDLLPLKYNVYKELLFAVKWLGNAGSHEGKELTIDDVMDAYEIMEHILVEIYSAKTDRLKAIAKKVNKNKGPK